MKKVMKSGATVVVVVAMTFSLSSLFYDWRCWYYPALCLIDFPAPKPQPKPCMPIGVPADPRWV